MAIALVQGPTNGGTLTNTVTRTWLSAPTAGNLLIAVGQGSNAIVNASISGWTLATSCLNTTTRSMGIWYKVASASEGDVVLNWTSSSFTNVSISEWSGLTAAVLDKVAKTDTTGSTVTSRSSGTTAATTADEELCIAIIGMGAGVTSLTWSNSYTNRNTTFTDMYWSNLVQSTAGAQETTASWTTARLAGGCIATFKASSTSGSVTPATGSQSQVCNLPGVSVLYLITPSSGQQTQTSNLPSVSASHNVTPASGSQSQSNNPASGVFTISIAPASNSQTQSGNVPSIIVGYNLTPATGTQTQTFTAPGVSFVAPGASVTPASNSQTQTSDLPGVVSNSNITPAYGQQTQTSDVAGVSYSSPNASVTPAVGSQSQTGNVPTIGVGYNITPVSNTQSQTGDIPGVSAMYLVTPDNGSQTMAGALFSGVQLGTETGWGNRMVYRTDTREDAIAEDMNISVSNEVIEMSVRSNISVKER